MLKKNKIILVFFTLYFTVNSYSQCAMCRAVLESEETNKAAQGINDGIMFLMAIPYILVFAIGYFVYKTYKNPKKTNET